MPLIRGSSKRAFRGNVRSEIRAGRSPRQAAAIAYRIQRQARARKAAATRKRRRRMAKARRGGKRRQARSTVNAAGNYTKPALRKRIFQRIKRGGNGGRPGQWSARKAQMLALAYKRAGGGYRN